MAKGRMISKSISASEKLLLLGEKLEECGLSEFGQLLYTWIIPHTDDYGRFDGSSNIVKIKVMPGSSRTIQEFKAALDAMHEVGLVRIYQIDGKKYLEIPDFDNHQTLRNDRPRIAEYPSPDDPDEAVIKEYLANHLEDFEKGLRFLSREYHVSIPYSSRFHRIDILAVDKDGRLVIIEAKKRIGKAFTIRQQIVEQLKYLNAKNARAIFAAPWFEDDVEEEAKKYNVELWKLNSIDFQCLGKMTTTDCPVTTTDCQAFPQDAISQNKLREGKLREGKGREGKECTTYIHTSSADKNAEDESVIDSELEPPDQEQEDPTPKKEEAIPQCPHQAIIDLYHKTLPELPRVRVWNDDQQKALRTRWKDDQQRRNLEWWKLFFELIRGSPFLMGRENGFQADLEWLIRPKNFAKIMNGRYHRQDQGKYTQTGYKNLEVMKSWLKKQRVEKSDS